MAYGGVGLAGVEEADASVGSQSYVWKKNVMWIGWLISFAPALNIVNGKELNEGRVLL